MADSSTDSQSDRYSHRTRAWLVALLIVTAVFAGGALYLKYKLEGLRASVQAEVESRTGARLQVGSVLVNGLRGLRLNDVEVQFEAKAGPAVTVEAPVCLIHINIVDLIYGQVTVERIVADRSKIRAVRPADAQWLTPGGFHLNRDDSLLDTPSFRLTGANSTLEIVNIVGDSELIVTGFNFDICRLEDSPDITAKLSGRLGQDAGKDAKMDLRYTSLEDFDLRMECAGIGPDDVAVFLPASHQFIKSGRMTPNVRIAGYPNNTIILAFESAFEDVALQGQPAFLLPAQGMLTGGIASYDLATHVLTLNAARAESNQIAGRLEGSISFARAVPEFDLKLDVTQLPLTDVLDYSMTGRAKEYGILGLKFQEPYELQLELQGTTEEPVISVQGNISGGEFGFEPKDTAAPRGTLRLGVMTLAWNSRSDSPAGSFSVVDGSLSHEATGITAEKVAGTLKIAENRLTVDPLTAEIGGNPFVGGIAYDFASKQLELNAAGTLPALETVLPPDMLNGLTAKGPVNVRCNIVRNPAKMTVTADVDATQADLAYQWWLSKPAGIGAACKDVTIELVPGKSLVVGGQAALASSEFNVEARFSAGAKPKWEPRVMKASSSKLDVNALGRCIRVPYEISGSGANEMQVVWQREAKDSPWKVDLQAGLEQFSMHAECNDTPMQFTKLNVTAAIEDSPNTPAAVSLAAKKAVLPPLKSKWFAPLDLPAEAKKKYTLTERNWAIDLAGGIVEVGHWKGKDFKGKAYMQGKESGLSAFRAVLDGGGQVDGAYRRFRDDNRTELAFKWNGIQAGYLTRQLGYADIVAGKTSGEIAYSVDSDDPGTLTGKGKVDIADGQLSADYVISKLQGRLENQITSIPVSLKFSSFKTDVGLESDLVTTNNLRLESNGINVTGNGQFVLDGDVDYNFKVAISPDLAEKIPALRDNMNVQGLRLAQQNVELSFNVKGPIFNPKAELASLPPVHVTVVSSALEATSDAMKVLDIPRKILVDLLKIGGGIMGM